jgi:serine/threonine protein kinase
MLAAALAASRLHLMLLVVAPASPPRLEPTIQEQASWRPVDGSAHAIPEIPDFEVLRELGVGGHAIVYLARQRVLDRMVAIKMMRPDVTGGTAGLARFVGEARSLADLQHPNIVQIHDVGVHDNRPYLVLELVDGGNLDAKLRGEPQPVRDAAALIETLSRAVAAAHAHGVIHRDLKPANILLAKSGVPRIADFGIAKRVDDDRRLTRTGALMGTPSYMAPEQIQPDGVITPAVDIYALGGILYEMLVGHTPFDGTAKAILRAVTGDPAPAPRRLRPQIPRDLETICCKCLDKDPARRYATASALADDLRRFLAGEPIVARPVSAAGRLARWSRRHPATAALGGLSLALIATLAIGGTAVARRLSAQDRELAAERAGLRAARCETTPGRDDSTVTTALRPAPVQASSWP